MNGRFASIVCTVVVASGLVGCRKPILPQSGIIPLKVWVVLGLGDSVGNRGNKGCRLETAEIQAQILDLQAKTYIYGSNIKFQWLAGTPTQAQDAALLPTRPRTRQVDEWQQRVVQDYWTSEHLNIYFVGNVQRSLSNPTEGIGLCRDPRDAERPWIVMNDGVSMIRLGSILVSLRPTSSRTMR